jgi:hypothetical protein
MSATPLAATTSIRARDHGFFARLRRGMVLSIGAAVAGLRLTLPFVAFWAYGFTFFQSVVVVVVSLRILGAVLFGARISFGLR